MASVDVWRALGLEEAVGTDCQQYVPIPICDETLAPLPVLFPPHAQEGREPLLESYLDVLTMPQPPSEARQPIRLTRQKVPGPSVGPADDYFTSVWQRRIAATTDRPLQPSSLELSRANSASWELISERSSPPVLDATPIAPGDSEYANILPVVVGREVGPNAPISGARPSHAH